jgi:hypothetical protein
MEPLLARGSMAFLSLASESCTPHRVRYDAAPARAACALRRTQAHWHCGSAAVTVTVTPTTWQLGRRSRPWPGPAVAAGQAADSGRSPVALRT